MSVLGRRIKRTVVSGALMVAMSASLIGVDAASNANTARISGNDRYGTSFAVADRMYQMDGKYDSIVLVSGNGFADAMSGAYLADERDGPLMLVNSANENKVKNYVKKYLERRGTVYILGGTNVVSSRLERDLKSLGSGTYNFKVKRLSGNDRYKTNLAVLKECEKDDDGRWDDNLIEDGLIIATGKSFADSLSASAAEKPIMLVSNSLTSAQKQWIASSRIKKFYIVGGTGAVSKGIENTLSNYGKVERIAGADRWETSYKVAKKFRPNAKEVLVASGNNYPDGLSGAPLAMDYDGPIILVSNSASTYKYAKKYVKERDARRVTAIGGKNVITNGTLNAIADKSSTSASGAATSGATSSNSGRISKDKAKSIAVGRAGLSVNSVRFTEARFEYDDGVPVYQIDFIYGTREYDVEVHAITGKIREYDVDSIYD